MDLIKNFLNKYKNLSNNHLNISTQTQTTIKEVLNIDLSIDKISYRNGIIFITSSPLVKGEIFLNKQALIDGINQSLEHSSVRDIR